MSLHNTNILCVRLDNIGDVIMATPAFRAIKESFPTSTITLLTSASGATIAPFIPSIDTTYVYDAPWIKHTAHENFQTICTLLKKKHFDMAIIFTNFSQSPLPAALLCYMADIPHRVAYCRENPYELLTTWIPDTEPFSGVVHGVIRQLNLVKAIGATTKDRSLELQVKNHYLLRIQTLLSKNGISTHKPLIVVHPGASESKRQYDITFYASLVEELLQKGYQIILTGTRSEDNLHSFIAEYCHTRIPSFTNLSMGDLLTLIKISHLLISNNTGPMHIAAALQTPIIALYAQTNPEHTPWQVAHKIFYFPISDTEKSKNTLLQHTPFTPTSPFSVNDILQSVQQLL